MLNRQLALGVKPPRNRLTCLVMANNGGGSFPISREVEYDCDDSNGVKHRIAAERAGQISAASDIRD